MKSRPLIKPWPEIVANYEGLETESLRAIGALGRHICDGPLGADLYGWTSMHDLCIAQTETGYPPSGPFLKVSATRPNEVEFHYMDTGIVDRRWHRTVPPDETINRFSRFIDQLRWFGGRSTE